MAVESGVPVAMEPAEQPDVLPSAAISEPRDVPCLIIGGGPAGLAAAYELAKLGEKVLIVDDKDRLGGKLVLQTHTQSALLSVIWGSETAPPDCEKSTDCEKWWAASCQPLHSCHPST